jgi:translation elongation factor EF-1alpha
MKSIKGITVISKSDEADFSNKFKCKTTKLNSEQSLNSGNTSHIRVVKHHLYVRLHYIVLTSYDLGHVYDCV